MARRFEKLDDSTLTMLKINNIQSDHTLINSEFYLAQICCIFSEPITEIKIVNLRSKFYDDLYKLKNTNIYHLDKEVIEVLKQIRRPILFNENEIKPLVSALHKVLIEAVEISSLREFYKSTSNNIDKNYKSWKSIKLIDYLLRELSNNELSDIEYKNLVAPLYILNDLRILYFHIISEEEQEKLKLIVVKTLEINEFDDTKALYFKFLERLEKLYNYLCSVLSIE